MQLETRQPRSRRTRIFDRDGDRDEEKSSEFSSRGDEFGVMASRSLSDRTSSIINSNKDEVTKESVFLQNLRNKARNMPKVDSELCT